MSFSDDEEFLSADEDNIDQSDDEADRSGAFVLECYINDKPTSSDKTQTIQSESPESKVVETKIQETIKRETEDDGSVSESSSKPKKFAPIPRKGSDNSIPDDDDNNSEKDREKNLKIARKFSAEIAKSVQASAPAPVKSTPPIQINKPNRIQTYDSNDGSSKSALPPAPPPTPALSSSYSNTDDQPPSQFGWRVLPKSKQLQQKNSKICEPRGSNSSLNNDDEHQTECSKPTIKADLPSSTEHQDANKIVTIAPESLRSKSEAIEQTSELGDKKSGKVGCQPQARFALDRLSESVSQSRGQNIFEKVVDDLKRVSIKTDQDEIIVPPALPSIKDIGTRLGSWGGWGGVQTDWLMASASQVTSQVGSVLESVVNVAQQTVQQTQETPTSTTCERKSAGRKDKDD